MKNLNFPPFPNWRDTSPEVVTIFGSTGNEREGAFYLPKGTRFDGYQAHMDLGVIASAGEGWDHVSVSGKNRTPNWNEMMLIHRIFFMEYEITMQFCVPKGEHINIHPNVLHLWRSWDQPFTLPPAGWV